MIKGLNEEQFLYIKNSFLNYGFKEKDLPTNEEEWFSFVTEYWDTYESCGHSRHWENILAIINLGDRCFGWSAAITTGDKSATDKGFEYDGIIKEYKKIPVTTYTYEELV